MTNIISPSEAITGFAEWLTSRDDTLIVSRHNDKAKLTVLVERFCEVNNWEAPKKGWDNKIEMPSNID